MQGLIEVVVKSGDKEIMEEKILLHYVEIMFNILGNSQMLWLKNNYFMQMLIKNTVKVLLDLKKQSFANLLNLVLHPSESIFQIPLLRNHLHFKEYTFPTLPSYDHLTPTQQQYVDALVKEREKQEEFRSSKMKDALSVLMEIRSDRESGSSQMGVLELNMLHLICVNSLHVAEVLTAVTNLCTEHFLGENVANRRQAIMKLFHILAFRRKAIARPVYIYKQDYTSTEDCEVAIDSELLRSKGIDTVVYVDRPGFAWTSPPPYVKVYKTSSAFSQLSAELQKSDVLAQELSDSKAVASILKKSILDHEMAKERQLMEEVKESRPSLGALIQRVIRGDVKGILNSVMAGVKSAERRYFDLGRVKLYQACFEFYGQDLMKSFKVPISILLPYKSDEVTFISVLEVICGFLRASKVFDDSMNDYCFDLILRVTKEAPIELLPDVNKSLRYFLKGRDPRRWKGLWDKLFEGLLPTPSTGTQEKSKFFTVVNTMLESWLCRGSRFIPKYMEWYTNNIVQDNEKLSELAAKNLALILYHVATASQITTYQQLLQEAFTSLVSNCKDSRDAKVTLLCILREAAVNETVSSWSYPWVFKLLSPLCYQLMVRGWVM